MSMIVVNNVKEFVFVFVLSLTTLYVNAQINVSSIDYNNFEPGKIHQCRLMLIDQDSSTYVPMVIIKGEKSGPILGITAAIHGNELNGVEVIHKLIKSIDPKKLNGILVLLPVLNTEGLFLNQRDGADGKDLNRIFPGNSQGSKSQKLVWNIKQKILTNLEYLIDMHTASFGNVNTYYIRADLKNDTLHKLAVLQNAPVILESEGLPSAGTEDGVKTMRAEASEMGVKSITVEYGNPQVFQKDMIRAGFIGIKNAVAWLGMYPFSIVKPKFKASYCQSSSWSTVDTVGFMQLHVSVGEYILKGQKIATIKNFYGDVIKSYESNMDGIIIGMNNNPVVKKGSRLIHLGIKSDKNK